MCENEDCTARKIAQWTHFVSKKGINVDGLSKATLETLISHGILRSFKDLFYLSNHKDSIVNLDGFGERSYQKLIDSIDKSRNVTMDKYIASIGIPNVGQTASKVIAEYFDYDYEEFCRMCEQFDFTTLEGFGEAIHNALRYWHRSSGLDDNLAEEMNFIIPVKTAVDNSMQGIKFCITGSFSKPRDELKSKLEARGAKFVSSVSKNLDILFCGEKAGSKQKKATDLGVKIILEKELLEMLDM